MYIEKSTNLALCQHSRSPKWPEASQCASLGIALKVATHLLVAIVTYWNDFPSLICSDVNLHHEHHSPWSAPNHEAGKPWKKKCLILGFDCSPNLPARQVHRHHLINVSLENPRSSQVLKYNPGKIMVDVKSENNYWGETYLQGGAYHSKPPQEHKLPEQLGLLLALHCRQPGCRVSQTCLISGTPSEHLWIFHWQANCRSRQSSSSSTQLRSQIAPCRHPW